MTSFVVILGLAQLLIALSSLFAGRHSEVDERTSMERETPSVTLFVPCCGDEEGLATNLKALAQQDYPNLRLVFAVKLPVSRQYPSARKIKDLWIMHLTNIMGSETLGGCVNEMLLETYCGVLL